MSDLRLPDRTLLPFILKDLNRKMVFLGGPRQVGKTTLAQDLLNSPEGYFNYDSPLDRRKILKQEFSPNSKLLVFDEIHKNRQWRNVLKGIYDTLKKHHQFFSVSGCCCDPVLKPACSCA